MVSHYNSFNPIQKKMTTTTDTKSTSDMTFSSNQQQQQQGMLLLEPYQPMIFMEDDWDNSIPPLTNDEQQQPMELDQDNNEDLFASMDFVDVSFSLPPTPSNSAPQSPSMPLDKSTTTSTMDMNSAEELLSMLMQTYCPQIQQQQQQMTTTSS
ncbi:hypothetical protein BDA99DRAFT_505115 [Phascolomyces articulosus]|uniref:Uncharacterized protein n=1 Tax=Phascolomyces articulosus TaxID=60185 RepID=A0AAD5KIX6_9FUNG|nr:hypothetical protein BDA99DRAFT_505115 [Phascolomyces articulosus]